MQHRTLILGLAAVAAAGSLVVGTDAVQAAGRKTFEDKRLGYRLKLEDDWTQNPPKLTTDAAFIVGDWYQDAAKFDSWQLKPTMQLFWFVTPKDAPKTGAEAEKPDVPFDPTDPEAFMRSMRDQMRHKSVDEVLDSFFELNVHLFGEAVPMKDRWAKAEKDKTAGKIEFQSVEINAPNGKKRNKDLHGYAYAAKFTIDRPNETIEVGFLGSCSVDYFKRFSKEFPATVRSFEELKAATDSRNEGAMEDLSQDRETRYQQILKQKLVKGWKADRTKNYILVYHEEVDPRLVKDIGKQIEAIRAQVYEVLFPPDKPVTAFSIVRVCKDQTQYMGYGAPGGSAGYWDSNAEELVFYEDQNNKKDSLRVLYHEAFHQYIFYSVGDFAPHSWFNEGHGDYFAGHNYKDGKFERDVFSWRISEAKEFKHNPNRPHLKDWVNWTQAEYYGSNKLGISIGLNYAAGWSLVYFLRTTKKPEYQGVLDRYFKSLKGQVTAAREAKEAWNKKYKDYEAKLKEWEEKVKTDPTLPRPTPPEMAETSDVGGRDTWLPKAIEEGFKGIDWDAIEKDWLAAQY
jgi:uncharacterized protein DUF1570